MGDDQGPAGERARGPPQQVRGQPQQVRAQHILLREHILVGEKTPVRERAMGEDEGQGGAVASTMVQAQVAESLMCRGLYVAMCKQIYRALTFEKPTLMQERQARLAAEAERLYTHTHSLSLSLSLSLTHTHTRTHAHTHTHTHTHTHSHRSSTKAQEEAEEAKRTLAKLN